MAKRKPTLYVNRRTGEIVTASQFQAVRLPRDYRKIRFTKNAAGERVMRLELLGATVDISENKTAEVASSGNGNPE